jgi:uncharacterized protein
MMWLTALSALGLFFVFEGMMLFLSPRLWRRMMQQVVAQSDLSIQVIGLISMLIGLGLVCLAREFY